MLSFPLLPIPGRATLAVALASVAALVIPTAANATVAPPVVDNNTLTVTSDAGADTITLGTAGGLLTVNGTPTTLAATGNALIFVNAGEGDDVVDATALTAADYGSAFLNGGPGDDFLSGGADDEDLNGDAGNDRLVGSKGNDLVTGGDGDDVMVWNNGDNTDTNNGDAGTDETEVNGSPTAGDLFTFQPAQTPGRVTFSRGNLVQFTINLSAERLTVNGLGGNDQIGPEPNDATGLAAATSIRLNGGAGDDLLDGADGADQINGGGGIDSLFGNGGADQINGGDDDDTLFGLGGDDRLVGDRGPDLHVGGEGDDVLVWNNGDGSDTGIGQDGFDRLEVNGSTTGGDAFELAPDGANAVFQRTNLVPFTVALSNDAALTTPSDLSDANGGVEAVTVNGGGGDDGFTVSPGLPGMLVASDGGAGNDQLAGAEEADQFFGGTGDDLLTPGGGGDFADAGDGDDRLISRDGATDLVRGGTGTDRAETDSVAVDFTDGVEALDATPLPLPPTADTKAEAPALGKIKVVHKGRNLLAQVPLSCPAAEAGGCGATVTLETAKAIRLGKVRAPLVLGSKGVDLAPGGTSKVSVRLADGAAELAKRGKLRVRVRIASSDAAGNSAAGTTTAELRIPRR